MSESGQPDSPDEPSRQPAIWRDRNFDRYWAGHALSAFGDQISALGLPLIAVVVLNAPAADGPAHCGDLDAESVLPVCGHLGRPVPAPAAPAHRGESLPGHRNCGGPIGYASERLSMPLLYASALALGAGGVLYGTSYPSFFVRLVPRPQYVAANSVLSTTMSISALAGPAVAGLLIQAISAPRALLVDAATFAFSAIAIACVRIPRALDTEPAVVPAERFRARLRLGVAYLHGHPHLRASLLASTTSNLAAFMIQAVLIVFASRQLHLGAGQIGVALSIGAIGGLLGAVSAGKIAGRLGTGRAIALAIGLTVLPFAVLPLGQHDPTLGVSLLAAAEFVSAWAIMVFDINNNALRAVVTADDMRARVSGAYSTVNYGSRPLGAVIGGWSAMTIGIPGTLVAGAVLGVMSCGWIIRSPVVDVRDLAQL